MVIMVLVEMRCMVALVVRVCCWQLGFGGCAVGGVQMYDLGCGGKNTASGRFAIAVVVLVE